MNARAWKSMAAWAGGGTVGGLFLGAFTVGFPGAFVVAGLFLSLGIVLGVLDNRTNNPL